MYEYIGPGYVLGVPARNLTDDEWARYRQEIEASNGLHLWREPAKGKPKGRQDQQAEPASGTQTDQ